MSQLDTLLAAADRLLGNAEAPKPPTPEPDLDTSLSIADRLLSKVPETRASTHDWIIQQAFQKARADTPEVKTERVMPFLDQRRLVRSDIERGSADSFLRGQVTKQMDRESMANVRRRFSEQFPGTTWTPDIARDFLKAHRLYQLGAQFSKGEDEARALRGPIAELPADERDFLTREVLPAVKGERERTSFGMLVERTKRGVAEIPEHLDRLVTQVLDLRGADRKQRLEAVDELQQLRREADPVRSKAGGIKGFLANATLGTAEIVPVLLAGSAASAAVGGLGGAAFFGSTFAGEAYQDYRSLGMDDDKASIAALVTGPLEGAAFQVLKPLEGIIGPEVAAGAKQTLREAGVAALRRLGVQSAKALTIPIAMQASREAVGNLAGYLDQKLDYPTRQRILNFWKSYPESAASLFLTMLPGSIVQTARELARSEPGRARQIAAARQAGANVPEALLPDAGKGAPGQEGRNAVGDAVSAILTQEASPKDARIMPAAPQATRAQPPSPQAETPGRTAPDAEPQPVPQPPPAMAPAAPQALPGGPERPAPGTRVDPRQVQAFAEQQPEVARTLASRFRDTGRLTRQDMRTAGKAAIPGAQKWGADDRQAFGLALIALEDISNAAKVETVRGGGQGPTGEEPQGQAGEPLRSLHGEYGPEGRVPPPQVVEGQGIPEAEAVSPPGSLPPGAADVGRVAPELGPAAGVEFKRAQLWKMPSAELRLAAAKAGISAGAARPKQAIIEDILRAQAGPQGEIGQPEAGPSEPVATEQIPAPAPRPIPPEPQEAAPAVAPAPGGPQPVVQAGPEQQRAPSGALAAAQAEADAEMDPRNLRAIFNPTGEPFRPDELPEVLKAPHPEIDRRVQATYGTTKPGLLKVAKDLAGAAWARATRAQVELPNIGKWATANEVFRLSKGVHGWVPDEVARRIQAIINPLGPRQLQIFEAVLRHRNQIASLERGEPVRHGWENVTEGKTFASEEERKTFILQQMRDYRDRLQGIADQVPEVKQALENRRNIVKEHVSELVDYEIAKPEWLDRAEDYWHQQVISYQQADGWASRVTRRLSGLLPRKRSFEKHRLVGPDVLPEEYDWNTKYLDSETAWFRDSITRLEQEKLFRKMLEVYQQPAVDMLKKEAKVQNLPGGWREALDKHPELDSMILPPGHIFYPAFTIPEKLVERLLQGIATSLNIKAEDLRKTIAIGPPREVVLPKEIIRQFAALQKPRSTGLFTVLDRELMRAWKVWTLLNPKRAPAYFFRNITGDVEPVITTIPAAMVDVVKGASELWRQHQGQLVMSKGMRDARDLAVIDSGMTEAEIPDRRGMRRFQQLYGSGRHLLNLPGRYFDWIRGKSVFRENIVRYGVYNYYLDAIAEKQRSGKPFYYGGAKKEVVDALIREMGPEFAAAHLARQMVGDYGNLTVMGEWLRDYVWPFWSFQEIQFKRAPRMYINAWQYARESGQRGRALGYGALATVRAGLAGAALTLQIGAAWGLLKAFNNLVFPDEEADLSAADRSNPHINTGRKSDGSVRIIRNVGAMGEFLEWFGINDAISLWPMYEKGQLSGRQLLWEMAKSPINKAWQGLSPAVRGIETALGVSSYPDVTRPRAIDRGEGITSVFGLQDEYRAVRGALLGTGERARPNYMDRWFFGIVDPRAAALADISDARERFLKQEGKEREGIYPISPFTEMRRAGQAEDYGAFKDARKTYLKAGKDYDTFKASLRFLDPISQRLSDEDERKFKDEFLTDLQRSKLRITRDYAHELEVTLWRWWNRAAEEEGQGTEQQKRANLDLGAAAYRFLEDSPARKKGESQSHFELRQEQSRSDVTGAWTYLQREPGLTEDRLISLLTIYMSRPDPATGKPRHKTTSRFREPGSPQLNEYGERLQRLPGRLAEFSRPQPAP